MSYIAGQLVRMATYAGTVAVPVGGFRDATSTLFDPATVTLKFKDPTGTVTSYNYPTNIVKDGVGLYHYDIDTTGKAGVWTYEWISPAQTIAANSFVVTAQVI